MNYNKYLLSALSMLLFSSAVLSCSGGKETDSKNEVAKKDIVEVRIAPVEQDSINIEDEFTAYIMAENTINISGMNGVKIEKILVKVGDNVTKGQLLATLDKSQLNQVKINMEKAKIDFERTSSLYQAGAIAKTTWEQSRDAYNIIKVQYQNIKDNTELRSPISGVITAKNYDDGNFLSMQTPILVVEQISPVKLTLKISDKYYSYINKGMNITVKIDAIPNRTFDAIISNIYPVIDTKSQTISVELRIDNKDKTLRPGMYAKANILFGKELAMLIPDAAVLSQQGAGGKYVYIYKDGKAIYKEIEIAKVIGDKYQVKSGISIDDKVITTGHKNISDGIDVVITK